MKIKEIAQKIKTKSKEILEKIKEKTKEIIEKIQLDASQYIKILVAVLAVLLVGVILVVALTRDKDQYTDNGEGYTTPQQEETTTEETTPANQFDDSNIGEWLS